MKIKQANTSVPEIDMTPMIDIVFQLITFFMVINNFDQNEADERVTLPRDQLAKPPAVQRKNSFTLNFGFDRDTKGNITDQTPYLFLVMNELCFSRCDRDCSRNLSSTRQSVRSWKKLLSRSALMRKSNPE